MKLATVINLLSFIIIQYESDQRKSFIEILIDKWLFIFFILLKKGMHTNIKRGAPFFVKGCTLK